MAFKGSVVQIPSAPPKFNNKKGKLDIIPLTCLLIVFGGAGQAMFLGRVISASGRPIKGKFYRKRCAPRARFLYPDTSLVFFDYAVRSAQA